MELKKLVFTIVCTILGKLTFAQSDTVSIRLYGNKNCKSQLETISNTFENVTSSTYDTIKGRMRVTFTGEFNKDLFIFHFASKGYDAENVRAKDAIYNSITEECKYVRKPEDILRD